jgi:hypothetical protein
MLLLVACARTNALGPDASTPDGGSDADCRSELCNGSDEDCDGRVDEDANADCLAPGRVGTCARGSCSYACAEGTADCNGLDRDGCETDIENDRTSCGACGRACGMTELCESGACRREHIVDFGAGENVCVVLESGRVVCTGPNDVGGNGDGTTEERDGLVEVVDVDDAIQISTGTASCVATRRGEVWCWGYNETGVVAYPPSAWEPPTRRTDVRGVREVSVDADACVRLLPDGAVACWGHRVQGDPDILIDIAPTAELVPGLLARRLITNAGAYARFAVTPEGTAMMWGLDGTARNLGSDPGAVWPPQLVEGIADVTWIRMTGSRVRRQCAVLADGTATCRSQLSPFQPLPLANVAFVDIEEPNGLAFADTSLWEWDTSAEPTDPPYDNVRRLDFTGAVVDFHDGGVRRCLQLPEDRLACWYRGEPRALHWIPGFE